MFEVRSHNFYCFLSTIRIFSLHNHYGMYWIAFVSVLFLYIISLLVRMITVIIWFEYDKISTMLKTKTRGKFQPSCFECRRQIFSDEKDKCRSQSTVVVRSAARCFAPCLLTNSESDEEEMRAADWHAQLASAMYYAEGRNVPLSATRSFANQELPPLTVHRCRS